MVLGAMGGLTACVLNVPPGPELGACAEVPDGVYAMGQAGIGRCLAGPTDMELWTGEDGTTWLAVVNADPYFSFDSGSLLVIDYGSIDLGVDRNLSHDLVSVSLPLDRFASGLAVDPFSGNAVIGGRLSLGAATRSALDSAAIVDLDDPSAPRPGSPAFLQLQDDPGPAVWATSRAWVGNLTDHSVSEIDLSDDAVAEIDVAPDAVFSDAAANDIDASESTFALADTDIIDGSLLLDESWTLTWTDSATRVWAPEADGLVSWTSGGAGFLRSAFGAQDNLVGLVDADPAVSALGDITLLYTSTGQDILVLASDSAANDWTIPASTALQGGAGDCPNFLSGPVPSEVDARPALYVDARDVADGPAHLVLATSDDGLTFLCDATDLGLGPDVGFDSVEHPFALRGVPAQRVRLWVSLRSGPSWSIGVTESDDGRQFTPIVPVLGALLGEDDYTAPVVTWANGRYEMAMTHAVGAAWWLATAHSADGLQWSTPVDQFLIDVPFDVLHPPRVAWEVDPAASWRVEGRDVGVQPLPALAGLTWTSEEWGMSFVLTQGAEDAPDGIETAAVADLFGRRLMFATRTDTATPQLDVLQASGEGWVEVAADVIPRGTGGNRDGVEGAAVVVDGGVGVLFYGARDGEGVPAIRRATTADGQTWTTEAGVVVEQEGSFDAFGQVPHSVERTDDGFRLWFAGFDGSIWRIAAATSTSLDGPWTLEPGAFDPYQLGTGFPGGIDDSGVRDPLLLVDGDRRHLFYSAFDGELWHLGHAEDIGGEWVRRVDPITDLSLPALSGTLATFSGSGLRAPVAVVEADGTWSAWYTGFDGLTDRVGRAVPMLGRDTGLFEDLWYPAPRYPTAGDNLTFTTARGDAAVSVIELAAAVDDFFTTGTGMSSLAVDQARGLLYVTSKLDDFVYAVDIRDDGNGSFVDSNHHDLEGLLRVESFSGTTGYRDVLSVPQHGWLLLLANSPDAVVVLDADVVTDDDRKTVEWAVPLGTLALPAAFEDAGERTFAAIGGAGMAVSPDGSLLLVAHFRGNSVHAFDLTADDVGRELAIVPYVGENPHVVRFAPDGRTAVVANYLGEVTDDRVESTLMILDTDPSSPTFLQPLTWIGNL